MNKNYNEYDLNNMFHAGLKLGLKMADGFSSDAESVNNNSNSLTLIKMLENISFDNLIKIYDVEDKLVFSGITCPPNWAAKDSYFDYRIL